MDFSVDVTHKLCSRGGICRAFGGGEIDMALEVHGNENDEILKRNLHNWKALRSFRDSDLGHCSKIADLMFLL